MKTPGTISQLVGSIGVLPLDVAQAKSVCRFCHNSTGPSPGNPIVLNYGQEYAHQHCIDRAKASGTFIPARTSSPMASPAPQPLSAEDQAALRELRDNLFSLANVLCVPGSDPRLNLIDDTTRKKFERQLEAFDRLTADRFK